MLSNEINEFHNLHMPYLFKKPASLDQDIPYWLQYLEKEKGIVFVAQQGSEIIGAICAEIIMSNSSCCLTEKPDKKWASPERTILDLYILV